MSSREIERMRAAGAIVRDCLQLLADMARPGATTAAMDAEAERFIKSQGGRPEFKGYRGYPSNICASINYEVVHGIPCDRPLADGDILSLDVGVRYKKYVADAALTVPIGRIGKDAERLLVICREALDVAVSTVTAGIRLSTLCGTIQRFVEEHGYSVVRKYTGHGIGRDMHEEPQVPNFVCRELLNADVMLPAGTTLAIEPMINAGRAATEVLSNRWTVVTKDRSLSAHYEHTVAVTDNGADILTV